MLFSVYGSILLVNVNDNSFRNVDPLYMWAKWMHLLHPCDHLFEIFVIFIEDCLHVSVDCLLIDI